MYQYIYKYIYILCSAFQQNGDVDQEKLGKHPDVNITNKHQRWRYQPTSCFSLPQKPHHPSKSSEQPWKSRQTPTASNGHRAQLTKNLRLHKIWNKCTKSDKILGWWITLVACAQHWKPNPKPRDPFFPCRCDAFSLCLCLPWASAPTQTSGPSASGSSWQVTTTTMTL